MGGDERIHLGRPLRLDRQAALDMLREIGRDRAAMAELRRLLAQETGRSTLHAIRDEQVLAQLADRIASGGLALTLVRQPLPGAPPELAGTGGQGAGDQGAQGQGAQGQPVTPPPPAPKETTFFELHVLREDTGKPVASVPLLITLPSGEEAEHTTDANGKIRIDGIDPGACSVRCELGGAVPADTLIFLGLEAGPPPAPPEGGGGGGSGGGGSLRIAEMIKHKVKTGETLASLARSVGMSAQDLAKFNWGTGDPVHIEQLLRFDIGCTKKGADGKFVFDDSDTPGVLLLPAPFLAEGVGTGSEHVVRVTPATQARAWLFSV